MVPECVDGETYKKIAKVIKLELVLPRHIGARFKELLLASVYMYIYGSVLFIWL
jgi:hypothetical protein